MPERKGAEQVGAWARKHGAWVLVVVHGVGVVGMMSPEPFASVFLALTPLNLLFLTGVYALASMNQNGLLGQARAPMWLLLMPALLGLSIEIVGVNTGFPFGVYRYGAPLGPKVFGTPLSLALLWWLLVVAHTDLVSRLFGNRFLCAALVGGLMTAMDAVIEPVAIGLDFWRWEGGAVPTSNYLAWAVIAAVLSFPLVGRLPLNPLSGPAILILWGFFGAMAGLLS